MAHILVVDDARDIVALIRFLLEKEGHKVSEAHDGAQALETLGIEPESPRSREELPELIILDVMMPILDGFTVSRRVYENKKTRSIPVIILTAKGQVRDLFDTVPNVAKYIEKPFDPKKLREAIDGILAKPG